MTPSRPTRASKPVNETLGNAAKGSRQQADASSRRATSQRPEISPPLAADGYPLVKISIASSELIPTGQFANVSVGPATIEWYIDPREQDPIAQNEIDNAARALNLLGDLVQIDVVAVQRNLVLEAMQTNVSGDSK